MIGGGIYYYAAAAEPLSPLREGPLTFFFVSTCLHEYLKHLLLHPLAHASNARPARLKRRSAEADVPGTPRYCRAITLNAGKLSVKSGTLIDSFNICKKRVD